MFNPLPLSTADFERKRRRLGLRNAPAIRARHDEIERRAVEVTAFVYERDAPPVEMPETTAEAADILADLPHADDWQNDPTTDDAVLAAAKSALLLAEALPTVPALDSSYLHGGKRIPSWRGRLIDDIAQVCIFQVGHAEEAQTVAADELVAALRADDGTEIPRLRIEAAELGVRQAERRATLWGRVTSWVACSAEGYYPTVPMASTAWIEAEIADRCREIRDACGEPSRTFIAHRLLWGIARVCDRGILNCDERLARTENRAARLDIKTQRRAYELIEAGVCRAYQMATGDTGSRRAREPIDRTAVSRAAAAWIARKPERARYVA